MQGLPRDMTCAPPTMMICDSVFVSVLHWFGSVEGSNRRPHHRLSPRESDPKGWSTVLVTALGSWEPKAV
jgi:hypothetical protein